MLEADGNKTYRLMVGLPGEYFMSCVCSGKMLEIQRLDLCCNTVETG